MTTTNIAQRYQTLLHSIIDAERRFSRVQGSVALLGVSKKQPMEKLQAGYDAGLRLMGENYLQEAQDKMPQLPKDIEWHFIGHCQSNKAKAVAENFAWCHTVDSLKLATRLAKASVASQKQLSICLQVNIENEPTKSGISLDSLPALAEKVAELRGLSLRGLMCIPTPCEDEVQSRRVFARLWRAQEDLIDRGHNLDTLSMGMSHDYEAAIAEGATLIRVGSALFGERQ